MGCLRGLFSGAVGLVQRAVLVDYLWRDMLIKMLSILVLIMSSTDTHLNAAQPDSGQRRSKVEVTGRGSVRESWTSAWRQLAANGVRAGVHDSRILITRSRLAFR